MADVTDSIEREAKLGADPGFTVPPLVAGRRDVSETPRPERLLTAVYWDTADLRLTRWGHSLRHRASSDGAEDTWTVKLADGEAGPVLSRREVSFAGSPAQPPEAALSLVRAHTRHAPVVPVATLVTRRRRTHVLDLGDRPLLEVDDDEVTVFGPPAGGTGAAAAPLASFREVEVEVVADGRPGEEVGDLFESVVDRLRQAGAGRPDPTPKIVRALGERALAPPDVVVPEVGGKSSIEDVVLAAVASGTLRLLHHDPGVRLGDDDEDVHQARVATRRLRSDLRTFRPLLDEAWVARLRGELKWIGGELGAVRDGDVLYQRLRAQIRSLPAADAKGGAGLLRALAAEREAARERLVAALDTDRYLTLVDDLVAACAGVPFAPTVDPDRPARKVLPGLVARPWKRLAKAVAALDEQPADAALHEVRKRAKQARYASEAAAPAIGKPAAKLAKRIAGLQGVLGDLQDAVLAAEWLREHGPAAAGEDAFAAGRLCALQEELRDECRSAWPSVWKAAKKQKLRKWLG